MNFPMFFCSWEAAKDYGFHEAILNETAWLGFMIALFCGAVAAVLYYLIVGKSAKLSNLLTWFVAMIIAIGADILVSDTILVGKPVNPKEGITNESLTYKYSFYEAIDSHAKATCESKKYKDNPEGKKKVNDYKRKITKSIDNGDDFRLMYELNCIFWTLIFFVLASYAVKNSTEMASNIPTYWPQKQN